MKHAWIMLLASLLWVGTSHGDIYKYMDDKGAPCFTDNIKNIPEKYRERAVLISKDEVKAESSTPPQADEIDKSLLPQKEEVKAEASAPLQSPEQAENSPYKNVILISSLFLVTLAPTFFVNNKIVSRILKVASLASMLTLLVYISTFFVSKHMQTLKNDAKEITETMKKKEEEKGKAIQDILGKDTVNTNNQ
jgi:hypothetical protein